MKKYLVEIFDDSDGYGLAWESAGAFDGEYDARAYADVWRKESPEVPHRIVRRELVAEYRGGDAL